MSIALACMAIAMLDQPTAQDQASGKTVPVLLTGQNDPTTLPQDTTLLFYRALAEGNQQDVPAFWIGVQCEPAGEVAVQSESAEIGLVYRRGGLKVLSTTNDAPADKAGIKPGDVIILFNGKPMNEISDLLSEVGTLQDNEAEVYLIRDNRLVQLRVLPAARPPDNRVDGADPLIVQWYRNTVPSAFNTRLDTAYAWAVNADLARLPDDVELTFVKKGSEPASITIQRGKQSWTTDGRDLSELPDDVRLYVQRLVGATQTGNSWSYSTAWVPSGVYKTVPVELYRPQPVTTKDKLQQQIEQIAGELKSLREAIEQLKDD